MKYLLFIIVGVIILKFTEEFLRDKKVGEVFQHNGQKWIKVKADYAARMLSANDLKDTRVIH